MSQPSLFCTFAIDSKKEEAKISIKLFCASSHYLCLTTFFFYFRKFPPQYEYVTWCRWDTSVSLCKHMWFGYFMMNSPTKKNWIEINRQIHVMDTITCVYISDCNLILCTMLLCDSTKRTSVISLTSFKIFVNRRKKKYWIPYLILKCPLLEAWTMIEKKVVLFLCRLTGRVQVQEFMPNV